MPEPDVMPPIPSRLWQRPETVRSWTEFIVVAALVMSLFIRSSTSAALQGSSARFVQLLLTDRHVLESIAIDSGLLALFLFYLHWRGWKPFDFHIGLGWWTSLQAVGLLILGYIGAIVVFITLVLLSFAVEGVNNPVFQNLIAPIVALKPHSIHLSWFALLPWIVINGFLEELTCMGYIFNQLAARRGPLVAGIVTVFLRMACHTYQDPVHLAAIGALFSIYAVWYTFGRKLWPLILAHILLDLISISVIKIKFG